LANNLDSTMERAGAFGLSAERRLTEGAKHGAQIKKFMEPLREEVRRHRKEVRKLRREVALLATPRPPTSEAQKRAAKRMFDELLKKAERMAASGEEPSEQDAILQNEATTALVKSVEAIRPVERHLRDDLDWSGQ
jgi:hypothetical protein